MTVWVLLWFNKGSERVADVQIMSAHPDEGFLVEKGFEHGFDSVTVMRRKVE